MINLHVYIAYMRVQSRQTHCRQKILIEAPMWRDFYIFQNLNFSALVAYFSTLFWIK